MKRNIRRPRRGNLIVLSCALLTALLALVALAVDIGYIAHAHTELQRTADAVALAAAARLPDQTAAIDAGLATAQNNDTSIVTSLDANDFVFGWWNRNNSTFTTPPPANRPTNAVRVTVSRTEARGNPIALFFGLVLGREHTDITTRATGYLDRSLCGAFVGIQHLAVPGNPRTDSFDSVEGAYNAATSRQRGSVCSDGDIEIEGDAYIRGDARAGVNQDVILDGGVVVTGNIGNRIKPLDLPPVDASPYATNNNNANLPLVQKGNSWVSPLNAYGDFILDGTTVYTMPPGNYYFRNVTLTGQSTLNITGNTALFITGNLYRGGGTYVNNNTQIAGNLEIYMTGGTAEVTSDNPFYGVIYAPNTDVRIAGSADYFGAIVGKTLVATGSGMAHYDESLNLEHVDPPTRTTLVD